MDLEFEIKEIKVDGSKMRRFDILNKGLCVGVLLLEDESYLHAREFKEVIMK